MYALYVLSDIFKITNRYTRAKIRIISKDVNVDAIGAANHITRADLAVKFASFCVFDPLSFCAQLSRNVSSK